MFPASGHYTFSHGWHIYSGYYYRTSSTNLAESQNALKIRDLRTAHSHPDSGIHSAALSKLFYTKMQPSNSEFSMAMLMSLVVRKFAFGKSEAPSRFGEGSLVATAVVTYWSTQTWSLAAVRPPTFILDNKGIKTLARIYPTEIRNTVQVQVVQAPWQKNGIKSGGRKS